MDFRIINCMHIQDIYIVHSKPFKTYVEFFKEIHPDQTI